MRASAPVSHTGVPVADSSGTGSSIFFSWGRGAGCTARAGGPSAGPSGGRAISRCATHASRVEKHTYKASLSGAYGRATFLILRVTVITHNSATADLPAA